MQILAINTIQEHIGNAPYETFNNIPSKVDRILFEDKEWKVISRYFQYRNDKLDIVNIIVRKFRWWDNRL